MLVILGTIALVYFAAIVLALATFVFAFGTARFWALALWQRLALMGSLVLAGIVGAAGAAARNEETEPTFANDAHLWPSIPIGVAWSAQDIDAYNEGLAAAIKLWNASVGCEIFAHVNGPEAQIRVRTLGVLPCGKDRDVPGPEGETIPGFTLDCHDGTMEIQVNALGDIQTGYRVFLHELGHAIGLAHDVPGGGIMAPALDPMNVIEPNVKDVRALRARYCH